MNKFVKKFITIVFTLSFFIVLSNTVEAGFPTIFYTRGTTTTTDSIIIETSINPNNSGTTAWIEYGTSSNLTNPKETNHVLVGTAGHAFNFTINISNLSPNTLYYLRVVANNGENTVKGDTISLQTLPSFNSAPEETINQVETTKVFIHASNLNTVIDTINYPPENTTEGIKEVENISSSLGANAFSGFNFLPNTIPNWIAFIVLILTISVLFRKMYIDEKIL